MHYYDFHIGDFNGATRHLTCLERGIYRDMLDMYYESEQPLSLDTKMVKRKLAVRSPEESEAFDAVLAEFFVETKGGYFNKRCDEVIRNYHENKSAKSLAGKASAAKREQARSARLAELNGEGTPVESCSSSAQQEPTPVQQNPTPVQHLLDSVPTDAQRNPTNQEPITINQEPETNNQIKSLKAFGDFEKKRLADFGFDSMPSAWLASVKTDWPELHSDDIDVKWVKFLGHYGSKDLELCESDWFASFAKWIASDAPKLIEARKPKTEPVKRRAPPLILGIPLDRIIREKYQWEDDETCARRLKSDDLVSRPKVGAGL